MNKPTLVLSHNKILAVRLYQEFKNFFPENGSRTSPPATTTSSPTVGLNATVIVMATLDILVEWIVRRR